MSFTFKTGYSQDVIIFKATAHFHAVGYRVKTKGYILEAVNGRDYSTAWCIIFFLLGIIPFLIYWFTRKKNKIVLDVSKPGEITVTYSGRRAAEELERLRSMFT